VTTQRGGDPAATYPQDDEWFTHPVPRRPVDDAPYLLPGVGLSGSPAPDALSVDAVEAVRAVAHGAGTPWTPPGSTRAERRRAREAAEAAEAAAALPPPVPQPRASGSGVLPAPAPAPDRRASTVRWDGVVEGGPAPDWRESTMRWDGVVEEQPAPAEAEDWRTSTTRWDGPDDQAAPAPEAEDWRTSTMRWDGALVDDPADPRSHPAEEDPRRSRRPAGEGPGDEAGSRLGRRGAGPADEAGSRRGRRPAGPGDEPDPRSGRRAAGPGAEPADEADSRWDKWSGQGDEVGDQEEARRRRWASRGADARRRRMAGPAEEDATAFDPGNTGTWRVRDVVPGADGGRRTTIILRYLLGLLAVDHVRGLTRWAYVLPVVGLILLAVHPRWIGLAVLVLGIALLVGRAVAVRLIAHRTLPRRYRPVEDDLRAAVEAGKANLRGELRRVGMPSSALTLPRSVFRADSRSAARTRLRDIEIDRVLPRAQLDRALRVLDEAPSPGR
jgi:hypothetical protein